MPPGNTEKTCSKCAEVENAAEKGMKVLIYRNNQNTASQQDLLFIS